MEKNTLILILAIVGVCVTIILSVSLFAFFFINQKKKNQLIEEENRHQQEILQTQIEIQQQAFHNISREIHDNIGQVLSLIRLNLGRIMEVSADHPMKDKISDTNELTARVINDLRHLSKGLNSDFVQQFGLAGCLGFEMERLQNTGAYTTALHITGQPRKLELSKEFIIYRVAQECFNNIIKHARATEIRTLLNYTPSGLTIEVIDNGKGFNTSKTGLLMPGDSGSGLVNMQKRIQMTGGTFSCDSEPGSGTTVRMIIPCTA